MKRVINKIKRGKERLVGPKMLDYQPLRPYGVRMRPIVSWLLVAGGVWSTRAEEASQNPDPDFHHEVIALVSGQERHIPISLAIGTVAASSFFIWMNEHRERIGEWADSRTRTTVVAAGAAGLAGLVANGFVDSGLGQLFIENAIDYTDIAVGSGTAALGSFAVGDSGCVGLGGKEAASGPS